MSDVCAAGPKSRLNPIIRRYVLIHAAKLMFFTESCSDHEGSKLASEIIGKGDREEDSLSEVEVKERLKSSEITSGSKTGHVYDLVCLFGFLFYFRVGFPTNRLCSSVANSS